MIRQENLNIRFAEEADVPLILNFIKGLAEYERMENEVIATCDLLREGLFEKKKAEVLIGELDGQPVAFALFFHSFSTFLGRAGIYLEDLFVIPGVRGKGVGGAMLKYLAKLTIERGCGRLEWSCLDWNKQGIDFYMAAGAETMSDWTVYRLAGDTLTDFAEE